MIDRLFERRRELLEEEVGPLPPIAMADFYRNEVEIVKELDYDGLLSYSREFFPLFAPVVESRSSIDARRMLCFLALEALHSVSTSGLDVDLFSLVSRQGYGGSAPSEIQNMPSDSQYSKSRDWILLKIFEKPRRLSSAAKYLRLHFGEEIESHHHATMVANGFLRRMKHDKIYAVRWRYDGVVGKTRVYQVLRRDSPEWSIEEEREERVERQESD